ncbi:MULTISPECIES: site-2 protease family protein [unclassified Streptomyces]|uniref:site-2 protease family protein n=1 Tax=unclassified Streptomyces TaxID=2593676 RepID=UPI002B1CDAC5|nr:MULTISPECIES: site-2 protease family protein [unclassified Streptomyces]
MKGSIRIGSVRGLELRAHWSVPLIMLLFAYGLGSRTLPAYAPGLAPVVYAVAGVIGALLLLVSLVAHEVAHALTARRSAIPVRDITLWALGGMTRMQRPETPRAALAVAVSGPLTSLVLGGAALGVAAGVGAGGWRIPAVVLAWLGGTNLLLGVFNLLPAAPLDGGRVLQAALWWCTGDEDRAWRVAGRSGQVIGTGLAVVGWLAFVRGVPGGLWLMVIGWFVALTAAAERRWAELRTALRGIRVREAMTSPAATGADWLTVDRFLSDVAPQSGHTVLPLVDFEGRPSGVIRLRRLSALPSQQRETLRIREVATPLSQCTLATPDELLTEVLDRLGSGGGLPILVTDSGRLDGIVTAHDIHRVAQRHRTGPDGATPTPDERLPARPAVSGPAKKRVRSRTPSGSRATGRRRLRLWRRALDDQARRGDGGFGNGNGRVAEGTRRTQLMDLVFTVGAHGLLVTAFNTFDARPHPGLPDG